MSNLLLTNSLTRKKEIFKPINPKKISLYACGPTVYDNPHVGNARSLVVFDVLYRVLKALYGSNVTYVRNITDVDDKIINSQPTDGLWDDGRNDVQQLGMSYEDLEKAMENKNDPNYQKYLKIREKNLHKMNPIPVCKFNE